MKIKLLLFSMALSSCGNLQINDLFKIDAENDPRKTLTTDAEFSEYIVQFEIDYAYYLDIDYSASDIPVTFSDKLDKKYLGACYYYGKNHQWREIKISRKLWQDLDNKQRQALIYHELGHCALNREHRDEYYRSFPISIMNTYHIAENYAKFSDEYDYELFTQGEKELKKSIDAMLDI